MSAFSFSRTGGRRGGLVATLGSAALAAALLLPAGASAARPLDIGFTDSLFERDNGNVFVKQAAEVGSSSIRVNAPWNQIAPNEPAAPTNPADPAYNFTSLDNAVRNAGANRLSVLLTTFWAPPWAEGPNRPSANVAPPASWRPDAAAFGQFARALATRYSGKYPDPANVGRRLPRVEFFEAWNEPNLSTYITPQYKGKKNLSAGIYTDLLNAFYAGVKAVSPGATVVTAGTAPFGDDPGKGRRTRPMNFWREAWCLKDNNKKAKCKGVKKPKFDILAHHTINVKTSPRSQPADRKDVVIANFKTLTKALRAAERQNTLGTKGKHKVFANEVWWESNPPDKTGVSLRQQANYMQEALYLLWKQGARAVYFLQLKDSEFNQGDGQFESYQTGIFTASGKKKPSYMAVKFPFVTDRKSGSKVTAWGRSPAAGKVTIEIKKGKKFKKLKTVKAKKRGSVFTTDVRLRGKGQLRATVGRQKSLVWKQK